MARKRCRRHRFRHLDRDQIGVATAGYHCSGNRLWAQDFGGGGDYNRASDIAMNSAGSIYITGISGSVHGASSFSWVAKLDSSGYQLWKQDFRPWTLSDSYNKFSSESISAVAADSAGNFYLTGTNLNFNEGDRSNDAWVAKYS